jgi:hypothetical protein
MKTEAIRLYNSGLTVIPTKDKIPTIKSWGQYRENRPTLEQFKQMPFTADIAVLGGGGVFCIDLDTKYDSSGIANKFMGMLNDNLREAFNKLYLEQTPSGGFHLIGRCETRVGNLKLCVDKDQKEACIETKGDGGYFVVSPSIGYKTLSGDLANLEPITPDDLDTILNTARILTHKKPEEYRITLKEGTTPLDDYDSKHDGQDIINLLLSHGWGLDRKKGEITYLKRPGKQKGFSASVNKIPDRLWVFSSNTDFDQEKIYSPSAVLCVLEYGGNFSACAKDLYKQGYGQKKEEIITKIESVPFTEMKRKLLEVSKGVFQKGLETGWDDLKELYRVADHQLTIVTGIPTHGKSTWVDHLFVNLATFHKWKFLIFSPESYPPEVHWRVLAEKYLRRDLYKATEKEIDLACKFLESHFELVDCSKDDITLDQILSLAKEKKVNGLLIDPWNELEYDRPKGMSETDHIGYSLKKIRTFSRNNKIASWVVAHPQKQYKDDKGNYKRPTLYDIAGSAHWYNKADNGVIVFRDENGTVKLFIDKVKFRYYGKRGEVDLFFNETYRGYENINRREDLWQDQRMK